MIKNNLREYIEEKGIAISYIHEKTGIRYATIHDIISGKNTRINIKHLDKIMEAINISDMNLVLKKTKVPDNKK